MQRFKKENLTLFVFALLFAFLYNLVTFANISDTTLVEKHGQLSVEGTKIVDAQNDPIILRGMSLFWSQWEEGAKYYNAQTVKWLKDDWNCTVVRAAMGVEMGGYLDNKDTELAKILRVIDACIDEGIYVIVDWHDHHAENHRAEAIEFFKEIAETYGDEPNIIYEIYNEPLQVSWGKVVKPYAEAVISEIRAIDSNNVIIVGTPTWSQDVDFAATNPLKFENIAYSLHFYAATHKQTIRDKAKKALEKGVALFVSEYGTCESTGNGIIDYDETAKWFNFMEDNQISYCNWSISDKVETSAALVKGSSTNGGWSEDQITLSGKLVRDQLLLMDSVTDVEIKKKMQNNGILLNSVSNYPNPFNSTTVIHFSLKERGHLRMDIVNMLGENIFNLIDSEYDSGQYTLPVNFSNFPSGNYLLRYQINNSKNTIKLQYIK